MDPVFQRLGDVTIQRLDKPKENKVEPQGDEGGALEKEAKVESPAPSSIIAAATTTAPSSSSTTTTTPIINPTDLSANYHPPLASLNNEEDDVQNNKRIMEELPGPSHKKTKYDEVEKKFPHLQEEYSGHSYSDHEMSDYESESDIESDVDLPNMSISKGKMVPEPELESANSNFEEESQEPGSNFLEQLVHEPFLSQDEIKSEPKPDDDYDYDIKEKLKEMGEISFETVKKGDPKPKKLEINETEVSVVPAKKTGNEEETVSGERKGTNMRRNIREVMDETKLDESTLAAQRQEVERLRRVQEQQRLIREVQRQMAQEKVISLLQGNNMAKAGTSSGTKIGNTVLVKLPNGQTKPMTKLAKKPFELMRVPKGSIPPHPKMGRSSSMLSLKRPPTAQTNLTPSVSIAPVGKRPMSYSRPPSESDSDSEEMSRKPMQRPRQREAPITTIDISSDDDCIVVSESENDPGSEEVEDPTNSGMHTNDEFNQPDEQGRVVINIGHPEDETDIYLAPQIARIIKPHQIGGIRFLYDNIIESTKRFETSTGFGCILAHSMGLGKTLQVVTFSDIFLRHTPARTILCIMPINTLQNWLAEYNMWLPTEETSSNSPLLAHGEVRPRNFNLHVLNDSHKTLAARAKVIHEWKTAGGVLLIGYEQYRLLSLKKYPKSRSKKPEQRICDEDRNKLLFEEVHEALVKPGPDLVICDEGHRIKNSHASISQALKQMRTKRRVVLTGYPLQNNLMEYWCMVDFVRPNYLGTKTEFCNMFERPIQNGQCIDSTEADIKLMRYRAHVLHSLLVGFVQRRSHRVLQTALPQKEEYVLLVRMTTFQRTLYETFMNEVVRTQTVPNPLKAFAVCCKIWNHPDVLYYFLKKQDKGEAVDIDLEEVSNSTGSSETPAKSKSRAKKPPKGKNAKPAASITPYNTNVTPEAPQPTPQAVPNVPQPPNQGNNFNNNQSTFPNNSNFTPNSSNSNFNNYQQPPQQNYNQQPPGFNPNQNFNNFGNNSTGFPTPIKTEPNTIKTEMPSFQSPSTPDHSTFGGSDSNHPQHFNANQNQSFSGSFGPNSNMSSSTFVNNSFISENSQNSNSSVSNQSQSFTNTAPNSNFTQSSQQTAGFSQNSQHSSTFTQGSQQNSGFNQNSQTNSSFASNNQSNFSQNNQSASSFTQNSQSGSNFPPSNQQNSNFNQNNQQNPNYPPNPNFSPNNASFPPGNNQHFTQNPNAPPGNQQNPNFIQPNQPNQNFNQPPNSNFAMSNNQNPPGNSQNASFSPQNPNFQNPNLPPNPQNFQQGNQPNPAMPQGNQPNSNFPQANQQNANFSQANQQNSNFPPGNQQNQQQTSNFPSGNSQNPSFPPNNQQNQHQTPNFQPGNPQNPSFPHTSNQHNPGVAQGNQQNPNFPPGNQPSPNFPPGGQQQTPNFPPGQQQNSNFPPGQQPNPNFPPGQQQNPNYPNQTNTNFPPTNSQNPNFPAGNPPNQNFPTGNPQNPNFAQGNQPNSNFPQANTQNANFPPGNPQNSNFPPGNQPNSSFPPGNPQNSSFPPGNSQNSNFPPGNPQTSNFPQNNQSNPSFPPPVNQQNPNFSPGTNQPQNYPPNNPPFQENNQQNANFPQGQNFTQGAPTPTQNEPQNQNYPQSSSTPNSFQNQQFRNNQQTAYPPGNNPNFCPPPNNQQTGYNYQNQTYWNSQSQDVKPVINDNYYNNFNQQPQQQQFYPNNQWIKKEDIKPPITVKSEMPDVKPKINIISDIQITNVYDSMGKISPEKKINILSDIKLEPKKEEPDFKEEPKTEFKLNEPKPEVKMLEPNKFENDDDIKLVNEVGPTTKMPAVKEDTGIPYDWAKELMKDYIPGCIENSAKMEILFCIIKESLALGDRLLVFSQSLITLDLIEQFLQMNIVPGDTMHWGKNTNYYRLDGSTSALEREKLINEFNANPKVYLFLVSTRAGSLGINLIGANRVVVLDASWNPCHDTQAVCRVYRYGQRKPCFVYRLVVDNCLEKKIYDRQINKQGMSDRVVDECNPDAHLTMKDVSTLCWDDEQETQEQDWSHTKENYIDVVLQKVLEQHGRRFNKEPFQHESLLIDRKDKQLSRQEKRLAKKGYEREKQAARQPSYNLATSTRGHRPVASVRPMQQGGERPTRWIPAEHWQRQGMTAQEMTLPLDVVIPTNQPDKGNIVLKAGQKVLVLKSPKGVYMQLESGKIVAIKTAIKVRGKAEEDAQKVKATLPAAIKNNSAISVLPQKRPMKPFAPGMTKLNMRSMKQSVPNLVSQINKVTKKVQMAKTRPYQMGLEIAKAVRNSHEMEAHPISSSEDERSPDKRGFHFKNDTQISLLKPQTARSESDEGENLRSEEDSRGSSKDEMMAMQQSFKQMKGSLSKSNSSTALQQLEQSTSAIMSDSKQPFQETLDSITSSYQDEKSEEHSTRKESASSQAQPIQIEDDSPVELEEPYDQPPSTQPAPAPADPTAKPDIPAPDYGYNNYYGYNPVQPYPPPPPQGYPGYPPQPPPYDMNMYPQQQQPYNYGMYPQGYPPQPQYPPPHPPPQPYDYAAPPPPQPIYTGYTYPQQYPPPPPPQGMYPPPAAPGPYPDYQYPAAAGAAPPPPVAPTYYPPQT